MRFRYDEDLVEDAVFLCVQTRRDLPRQQVTRFQFAREKLYRILDPDDRNDAFFKLHLEWFREWGLERAFMDVVAEFPVLRERLSAFVVRKARAAKDEAAELFVNEEGAASAVIAIRPERLVRDAAFPTFLRHELWHLHDMLDPAFGYSPRLVHVSATPAQQRLGLERYRLLWDITIDGRMHARGHFPPMSRDAHHAAFNNAFGFLTEMRRAELFEPLWSGPWPGHAQLAQLASDPRGVRDLPPAFPGSPCPLCGFLAFEWADAAQVHEPLVRRIVAEFPNWTPQQGLCGRCLHVYQAALRAQTCEAPPIDSAATRTHAASVTV